MRHRAIVLYGPPASGKDTITRALTEAAEFEHFKRLKCGPGRTAGYRMISTKDLARLRSTPGEVLYENTRYGATYVVDRSHLIERTNSGKIPILHLGQVLAVDVITQAVPEIEWLVVELWCPRPVAHARLAQRGTDDLPERLEAYDGTEHLVHADLRIDTGVTNVSGAVWAIVNADHEPF